MTAIAQRLPSPLRRWPLDLQAFVFLLLCVLIAWWPLASFTGSVVHGDMLDCWLPWRTFIADCLQNGEWPVWNPYQQMGYPVHADLQGPSWYPEALLLGGTVGQSIYVQQVLVMIYLLVAGMGMYRLAKQLCGEHSAALAAGAAYMLSGFFTAHVMHQYAFISGAWWPWMFAAFLRLLAKPGWRPALEAAVFQFLLLTGGNHTFTIIGSYLLLALIIVRGIQLLRAGELRSALRLILYLIVFAAASLIMACGVLHAWWYSAPFIARTGGLPYAEAMSGAFTWKAALSYFIPWATTAGKEITGTNITMANAHMSLVLLLFVPIALLRKRNAVENVLLGFGAVCLLASFGDALPVHRWLFGTLPGLNVFRFPSYYTFFTLFCWLPVAARTAVQWPSAGPVMRKSMWVIASVATVVIIVALARAAGVILNDGFTLANLNPAGAGGAMAERTLVHGAFQFVLLAACAAMFLRPRWFTLQRFLFLVAAEGIVAVLMCSWSTGISAAPPRILHRITELRPEGFPLPDATALGLHKDDDQDLQPLWRNTNIFRKRISHDGFNSFWPEQHLQLEQRWPILFQEMKAQPLLYIADSVVRQRDYVDRTNNIERGNALAVIPDSGSLPITQHFRREDSCAQVPRLSGFSPTSLQADLDAQCRDGLLVIQQQLLPGWKARLDGTEAPIVNVNGCAMGIAFTRGAHTVELEYALPILPWLRRISWCSFLLALCALALSAAPPVRWPGLGAVALVLGAAAYAFLGHDVARDVQANERPTCPNTEEGRSLYRNAFDGLSGDTAVIPLEARGAGVMALTKGHSDWSPAFEVDLHDLYASRNDAMIVEARYNMVPAVDSSGSAYPLESFIVLSVEVDGNFSFYRTKPLQPLATGTDGWQDACLVVQVEQLRWKPGKLKAYVWNNDRGSVLLDDFRVSVMPWDALHITY